MKMRIIKLTPEFLMERLRGKTSPLASNLPSDVELLDIKYDLFTKQVFAIIRSDSFEDTADAYPIPEFDFSFSANPKTAALPTVNAASKPEVKLATVTANLKTEAVPSKKVQVLPKRNTSLMEEEFSQEQRKLLSFSVDGNYVVVKPVKFLKAEWDDINEVVRSLGGRWVKGDIISYWEIPQPQS
jgi:hypothetical protein